MEGVIENEVPISGGLYQVGATVYGSDGMMEVNDNSLKYMVPDKAGWQVFKPTEKKSDGVWQRLHKSGVCDLRLDRWQD